MNIPAIRCFALLALCLIFMAGCAGGPESRSGQPVAATGSMAIDDYLIGVDDIIEVAVWRHDDLGVTVPVRADGKITIPLIGDIQAGGRRPADVAAEAAEELSSFVRDPQVTIIVTELRSHEYLSRVRVTGAVRSPVSLPYRQGMTVLDAVLAAGGPNEFAAANRSALHRSLENGERAAYALPLGRMLDQGDLSANHVLMPGDVITVPQRNF
ncbi:MAG: XrtA/PEP-CTERM system exopolysaccharide export protein [Wenzhouxiangella sp.]